MTTDPIDPPPAHGEDIDDVRVRRAALIAKSVQVAGKRLSALAQAHGGTGTVALANMGNKGVRLVFVAADGTFGDAVVPTVAAAEQVCADGGWKISGWDSETSKRIAPSQADRLKMAGTGR